jgi:chorismate mutase
MILEVTQEALDLNYDGMIIDVTDPDNAWRKQILKVRSK